MKQAPLFSLGSRDLVNGLIVAFLTSFLTGLVSVLEAGQVPSTTQLKSSLLVGLAAGVSYLLKNFLTNSQGTLMKGEGE